MTEVKVRRRRFLAALLGLIVLINTPAISVYAKDLYLGNFNQGQPGDTLQDRLNVERGKHVKPDEKITWKAGAGGNVEFTVQYKVGDDTYVKNEVVHSTRSGDTVAYTVRTLADASGGEDQRTVDYWILTDASGYAFSMTEIVLTAHFSEKGEAKEADGSGEHEHHFEWVVTREATEDDGGIEEYKCECGKILYTAPISAEGVFIKNTINKIINAPAGAAVEITTQKWLFFNTGVCDALSTRPDITLKINYREEGHKGTKLTTIIPKGTDLHKYLNDEGYVGFLYLRTLFPTVLTVPEQ